MSHIKYIKVNQSIINKTFDRIAYIVKIEYFQKQQGPRVDTGQLFHSKSIEIILRVRFSTFRNFLINFLTSINQNAKKF